MRWPIVGLLSLGVLAAICAAVLVSFLASGPAVMASVSNDADEEIEMLIAARDLDAMEVVRENMIVRKKLYRRNAPSGAVTDPVQVLGRMLSRPMVKGQAFSDSCFSPQFPFPLPEGMRAASLSLGCAEVGLARAGSLVDVVVGCTGEFQKQKSQTLLSRVLVLAIDGRSDAGMSDHDDPCLSGSGRRRMVTLMVDRRGAEALQAVKDQCSLSLTLRNANDMEIVEIDDAAEPAAQAEVIPVPPDPPSRWEVKINRGGTLTSEMFLQPADGDFALGGSETDGTP